MAHRHPVNGVGPSPIVHNEFADVTFPRGGISGRYAPIQETAPVRMNEFGDASFQTSAYAGDYRRANSMGSNDSGAPLMRHNSMHDDRLSPPAYPVASGVVEYSSLRKQGLQMSAPFAAYQPTSVALPPRVEEHIQEESQEGIYEDGDELAMCEQVKEHCGGAQAATAPTATVDASNYYTGLGPRTSCVQGMSASGRASVDPDPLEDLCAGAAVAGGRGSYLATSTSIGFGGQQSVVYRPLAVDSEMPQTSGTLSSFSTELTLPSVRLGTLNARASTAGGTSALWCDDEPELRQTTASAPMAGNSERRLSPYDMSHQREQSQETESIYYGLAANRFHK